jgi:hypothetical protein
MCRGGCICSAVCTGGTSTERPRVRSWPACVSRGGGWLAGRAAGGQRDGLTSGSCHAVTRPEAAHWRAYLAAAPARPSSIGRLPPRGDRASTPQGAPGCRAGGWRRTRRACAAPPLPGPATDGCSREPLCGRHAPPGARSRWGSRGSGISCGGSVSATQDSRLKTQDS